MFRGYNGFEKIRGLLLLRGEVAGFKDISSIWKNIKEIDLKPIRESATLPVSIALVGAEGVGRHTLAEQMRTDPSRAGIHTQSPIIFPPLDDSAGTPTADLIIIIVDATRGDFKTEQMRAKLWSDAGKNVLVFVNKMDLLGNQPLADSQVGWQVAGVLYGSAKDTAFLQRELIPLVEELLPQQHLALGRQFPLFRIPIARRIISETCFSNAAYSFSTGLAEIVPGLNVPLNVTDMIVLTKSQAFLAYRLGLLLGFSTNWQDYVTEFGSVIGSGFLWRQLSRQLIGLIPAWGIIPKVAVSYSGTYVVGNAILGWYLTGKHLTPKQLRALSVQAFSRGKEVARKLSEKIPRPRLGRGRKAKRLASGKKAALSQGETGITVKEIAHRVAQEEANEPLGEEIETHPAERRASEVRVHEVKPTRAGWRKKKTTQAVLKRTCSVCGRESAEDAGFCQYCGTRYEDLA